MPLSVLHKFFTVEEHFESHFEPIKCDVLRWGGRVKWWQNVSLFLFDRHFCFACNTRLQHPHCPRLSFLRRTGGELKRQKRQWGKNVYLLSKRNASCTLQINYSLSRPFSPRLFQFTIKSWLRLRGGGCFLKSAKEIPSANNESTKFNLIKSWLENTVYFGAELSSSLLWMQGVSKVEGK